MINSDPKINMINGSTISYVQAKNGEVDHLVGCSCDAEILPDDYQAFLDTQQPTIIDLDQMMEDIQPF